MSDTAPTQDAPAHDVDGTAEPANENGAFTQTDVDRIVRERLARERAKYSDYADLKAKAQQLAELEESRQSESERALKKAAVEAATNARAETRVDMGRRLAHAQLRAEAAGKINDVDTILDDLDLAKFVDEDGEPDTRAIKAAVTRLAKVAPAETAPPPFHGGPRTTAVTTDMNSLIRQRAGLE